MCTNVINLQVICLYHNGITSNATKSVLVSPAIQREKKLEVEDLSFLSITIFAFARCPRSKWWTPHKRDRTNWYMEEDILWKKISKVRSFEHNRKLVKCYWEFNHCIEKGIKIVLNIIFLNMFADNISN